MSRSRKTWKWLALGLGSALAIGIGVALYFYSQATALPDWYTEAAPQELAEFYGESDTDVEPEWEPIEEQPEVEEADPAPEATPTPQQAKKTKRKPKRLVMRGFHRRGKKKGRKTVVKASRATLHNGKLEAGVVVDLSRVPKDKLTPRDKRLYDMAVRGFPGITKRDVYIGIEDRPVPSNGVLQLGAEPKVRVGNIRYGIGSAARKIGMSEKQLRREFNRELRRLGFKDPKAP